MISLLTAFFLYHSDASWVWWVLFTIAFGWQAILGTIGIVFAYMKK